MTFRLRIVASIFPLFFINLNGHTQGKDTVDLADILDEWVLSQEESLKFQNMVIVNSKARKLVETSPFLESGNGLAWIYLKEIHGGVINESINGQIVIDKNLEFINIEWGSLTLTGFLFSNFLHFENTISKYLRISEINGDLWLTGVNIDSLIIGSLNSSSLLIARLEGDFVDIDIGTTERVDMASSKISNYFRLGGKSDIISIENNVFSNYQDSIATVEIDVDTETLNFLNNVVGGNLDFHGSSISKSLNIYKNEFLKYVDLHGVSFPELNRYIPFSQFKNGLAILDYSVFDWGKFGDYYTPNNTISDSTIHFFDQLVLSYQILHDTYKFNGDLKSANSSYRAVKELQLRLHEHDYRSEPTFQNFFRWRLAQLLKVYTNHGTDPAMAMVISVYIILIFAVFYFFFPSDWDVTSKSMLISNFRDFREKNEKGYARPFLGITAGFAMSLINAITLSLNSFVTLGFGRIPTHGLARYVCIIQGFIGWFLLSIFTVSLINQVLT